MQKIYYKNPEFLLHQKLFVELSLELCDYRSLDSYRARVLGPKSILSELYVILDDWKKNKIKSFETVESCKKELITILKTDDAINYGRSSKESFLGMANKLKDEKSCIENLLPILEYNLYYLLTINDNYIISLLEIIDKLLKEDSKITYPEEELLNSIEKNTGFLISELINIGFSKSYISKFIRTVFVDQPKPFIDCWKNFKNRMSSKSEDIYTIIFKITAPEGKLKKTNIGDLKTELSLEDFPILSEIVSISRVQNFLSHGPNSRFIVKEIKALDYYQALKIAKTEIANMLDLMHLGHYDVKIEISDTALVINNRNPEKFDFQSIYYQIDGYYKSHNTVYTSLSEKISIIKSKDFIAQEVSDKIEAAIRFLRTGSEAIELEQKYLSYWIALENIFSNYTINSMTTFQRIKRYFTLAHQVSYAKRNAFYFHKDIKRLDLNKKIKGYNDSLEYLLKKETFDNLEVVKETFPLLFLRSRNFIETYFLPGSSEKTIKRHKANLEQHLTRMYRIRNELVHNAATFQNIENITSNLRYYLIFIINKIVEFFCDCQKKGIDGKQVNMDDFFLYQEIILKGIEERNYSFEDLLKVPHPIENLV